MIWLLQIYVGNGPGCGLVYISPLNNNVGRCWPTMLRPFARLLGHSQSSCYLAFWPSGRWSLQRRQPVILGCLGWLGIPVIIVIPHRPVILVIPFISVFQVYLVIPVIACDHALSLYRCNLFPSWAKEAGKQNNNNNDKASSQVIPVIAVIPDIIVQSSWPSQAFWSS